MIAAADLDEPIKLRLKWRLTWPDEPNDFVGVDRASSVTVGRFYVSPGGIYSGSWSWFCQSRHGYASTPREAARQIEDAWFEGTVGKVFDQALGYYVDQRQNGCAPGGKSSRDPAAHAPASSGPRPQT